MYQAPRVQMPRFLRTPAGKDSFFAVKIGGFHCMCLSGHTYRASSLEEIDCSSEQKQAVKAERLRQASGPPDGDSTGSSMTRDPSSKEVQTPVESRSEVLRESFEAGHVGELEEFDAGNWNLEACYLHSMGAGESARLSTVRSQIPGVLERVGRRGTTSTGKLWGVDLRVHSEARDVILLKHLRAAEGDVRSACDQLEATLVFRADEDIDRLGHETLSEAFGEIAEVLSDTCSFGNTDESGRPVVVIRTNAVEMEARLPCLTRYCCWLREQALAKLTFASKGPEDICMILDLQGLSMRQPDAVRDTGKALAAHYPETSGVNILLNVPLFWKILYRFFKPFIPKRTQDRVCIVGDDYAELFKKVRPESLPEAAGGMLRHPSSSAGLSSSCLVARVQPGGEQCLEVDVTAGTVSWELRVCVGEVDFEVIFKPTGGDLVVFKSARLCASEGVESGQCACPSSGVLRAVFKNHRWFGARVCCFRAAPK